MKKINKMLDELDHFWYKMVLNQHRDSFKCLSEGFVGHENVMDGTIDRDSLMS